MEVAIGIIILNDIIKEKYLGGHNDSEFRY